jgi:hypothetical protein
MINKKIRLYEYSLRGTNLLEAEGYKKPSDKIDDEADVLFIKDGKAVISKGKNLNGEIPLLEFESLRELTATREVDQSMLESPTMEYEIDLDCIQLTYGKNDGEYIYPTSIHMCGNVIKISDFLGFRPVIRDELMEHHKINIKNIKK